MPAEAWRYILTVDGRDIELSDGEVTLGRSRTSTVRIDHESVSRSHALLTFERGQAVVKDLNSSNGTYVGGRRVLNETRLSDGDRIQLGAAVIAFRLIPPATPSERTAMLDAEPIRLPKPPPRLEPPRLEPAPVAADEEPSIPLPAPAVPPQVEPPPAAAPPPTPPPAPALAMSASELFREVDRAAKPELPEVGDAGSALEAVRAAPSPQPPLPEPVRPAAPAPPPAPPPVEARPVPPAPPPAPAARPAHRPTPLVEEASLSQMPLRGAQTSAEPPHAMASAAAPPGNLAGFGVRFVAALVDQVILTAINLLLLSPVFLILFFRGELQARERGPDWALFGVAALCMLLILAADAWYVIGGWARSGRTPGKSLLGLKIVTGPGARGGLGLAIAFSRAFFSLISAIPLGLGYWVILFRKDRRAWHDLLAGTWVVKTR